METSYKRRITMRTIALTALAGLLWTGLAAAQDDDWGQRIQDATITARIETSYLLNRTLNPFNIDTSTDNGVVTLRGTVNDMIERDLAEEIAASVDGVTRVENQIQVAHEAADPPARAVPETRTWGAQVEEETLRADLRSRLAYHNELRGAKLRVRVREGHATLDGEVLNERQRQLAEQIVRDTRGVRAVENQLEVDPALQERAEDRTDLGDRAAEGAREAGDRIGDAWDRLRDRAGDEWVEKRVQANIAMNRNVSMGGLDVQVRDGHCTISGTVISEQQRDLLTAIAQQTPGVEQVVNNVTVVDWRTET